MQIPILNGIYADPVADFRTSYPRNYQPVPKQTGISSGFLRPADGIVALASGPGADRGGWRWNDTLYRVMGTKLVSQDAAGAITVLGDVGAGGQVTMDNGFDRLVIWSGGRQYYWNGMTLSQVTDPDLGNAIDGCWIAGYYAFTDGTSIGVTELNDPMAVNPTKYGSSEADPDPVVGIAELRNELIAVNRFTIEAFQNVGGDNFPFQRIDGAQVLKGAIGTHAFTAYAETIAFLGSGKNEAPSIYLMGAGSAQKIATAEIDRLLLNYTEDELALVVLETKVDRGHIELLVHLPDRALVFDIAASEALKEPAWHTRDSGLAAPATYRARNHVWCYDRWNVGDPTSAATGQLTQSTMEHFGAKVGWDFGTMVLYNEGRGAIVRAIELVALPGRVDLGDDPVIWHSYSLDGETWSQEHAIRVGKQGERLKRIARRHCGKTRNYRMERFRGTSDARLSLARLEADIEALYG
ncbi:MAG: hypothetical protein EBR82_09580 [Caulobacteraceae bacterium]|nr:hypothetical protein [Caulobacteraceae bacterium]